MKDEFEERVRKIVHEKLLECSDEQIKFFNRMYGDIEKLSLEKMRTAYYQCVRTIKENEAKIDA